MKALIGFFALVGMVFCIVGLGFGVLYAIMREAGNAGYPDPLDDYQINKHKNTR